MGKLSIGEGFTTWARLVLGIGLVGVGALIPTWGTSAETFRVNLFTEIIGKHETADFGDALPGDGIAERTVGRGDATLRAAIDEANAFPGHDIILLPGGQKTMHYTELPALTDPAGVTIMSEGPGIFTLDGTKSGDRLAGYASLISAAFTMLDVSPTDGLLSYNEAANIIFVNGKGVSDLFQNLGGFRDVDFIEIDTNNDNRLSDEELKATNPAEPGFVFRSKNNFLLNVSVIGCAGSGVELSGANTFNNVIQGCLLGTDGVADLGNNDHGILIENGAHNNLIGGVTEEQRNIISGNGADKVDAAKISITFGHGIMITGLTTDNNTIIGNYIGVDKTGKLPIPNAFSGIEIREDAANNVIGGTSAAERNIIASNGNNPDGCGDNCGFGFYDYFGDGILLNGAVDTVIQGNWIGTTIDGDALQNKAAGIRVDVGTVGTIIGGATPGAGNIIAAHADTTLFNNAGILLFGSIMTRIENNLIGVGEDGSTVLVNEHGIEAYSSTELTIGGPARGNVISGNVRGVLLRNCRDVIVQGNSIGTDAAGTQAVPNFDSGLVIESVLTAPETILVGGPNPGEGNLISGNFDDGIVVNDSGASSTEPVVIIQGNKIGVDKTGTKAIPNTVMGILLDSGAEYVDIGGPNPGEGNLISGNLIDGIRVARSVGGNNANHIRIRGNLIGTAANGSTLIGNGESGVTLLEGATLNLLGGVAAGEANVIAGNGLFGVRIKGGSIELTDRNEVRGNSIFRNAQEGIRLQVEGIETANNNIAAPTIAQIGPIAGTGPASSIIDIYGDTDDEGRLYIGHTTTDGSGSFSVDFDLSLLAPLALNKLTATATDGFGNTSQFSEAYSVAPPSIITQPQGIVVVEGEDFSLSVEAEGSTPLAYQWEFLSIEEGAEFVDVVDDGVLSGSNTATLDATGARISDMGTYRCVVTNAVDSIESNGALVKVIALDTDTAEVSTLTDVSDANTSSPAHLIAHPGADGVISLREAISAANNRAGADTISFSVSGVITVNSGLPSLNDSNGGTTINGGGAIVIEGGNLGGSIAGLQISSADNVLDGLTIINFPGNGVGIAGATATGNTVVGCVIGTDGTTPQGNGGHGLEISGGATDNIIGGVLAANRNVISGNDRCGIQIIGSGSNAILGNYIGLSTSGLAAIANGESGVALIEGATANTVGGDVEGEGNVLSANSDSGVLISGAGTVDNVVSGNIIGLNATAQSDLGNVSQGVAIIEGAAGNLVGGTSVEAGNIISGNGGAAVLVDGPDTIENTIRFNQITGNFSGGIDLGSGGNLALAAPVITGLGSVDGTALPGSTVDLYTSSDRQGETYLATVVADGSGNFSSPVDVEPVVGLFITATATDGAGNTSEFSDGFFVDLEPPVLTLLGSSPVTVQCGDQYLDAGATAQDDVDGNITHRIVKTILFGGNAVGSVNTSVLGTYTIIYEVSDNAGQDAIPVTRTVDVIDTTAPVITLNGPSALVLECSTPYTEAGATATDGCDGALEVVTDNPVEPGTPGVYTVLYDATDASGNQAAQGFRTVTVVDTTPPVITLLGSSDLTVECGVPYNEPGASVTDTCENSLDFIVTGTVNTSAPGNYTLVYSASDSAGNVAESVTRIVRVADNAQPVITLNGPSTVNVACGGSYTEAGATAIDNCEGDLSEAIVISGSVNTSVAGNYTINYDVADSIGNRAARVSRTVVVAVCPAPCEDQCAGDPDNAIDEDGDGLSACIESCLGTSDTLIDSDLDGVPDGTEVDNGTDPVVPDSDLDVDGDGLTQLEEFIFDSDALDPNSPAISFFVSPGGSNAVGGGDSASPWATIAYAIAQSGASAVNPVRIILADGNYPEDVQLVPWVTLVGTVGTLPRIEGTVFGAHNSGLVNIEIAAFTSDDVMLVMDNVAMTLENVVFRGSAARPAAGILADGTRTAKSTIDGCLFTSVSIGIDVGGALPIIRRCTFEDTTIAGVFIRDTASLPEGASLGDVDDPSTGSNLFSGISQGRAIINELESNVLAQQNDWGTLDLNRINANLISGPITVAPVLAPGSAANTSSLYITVWTAESQARITNAEVTAKANGGASVTVGNTRNGVYSLPILRAGSYTIEVKANGFETQALSVSLAPGELGSQIVALQATPDKAGGPSCYGAPGSTLGFGSSDFLVVTLLLAGLLVGSFAKRVREER